ncbi:translation machinery-associated protein 22 isoform X2 [Lactuca sativa]|uniref:translation machinery-associated protein 22 isoform X2 n=1 Tax=Lactuca sativa TaxID=4236 RepID=UPI001C690FCE|nr:translation machinery-associated protein 22 isoform X2 [Lactuca sativa]
MAEKPQPVQVLYCGVCGLPAEYCEFGPDFEKCKPWLIQHAAEIYPDLLQDPNAKEVDKVSNQLQSSSIADGTSASVACRLFSTKTRTCKETSRWQDKKEGIKLSEASKKLGKKFATGASVVKGPTEKDQIDVQGDIAYDIVDFITQTWPDVPETAIFFIEDGKKVPAV